MSQPGFAEDQEASQDQEREAIEGRIRLGLGMLGVALLGCGTVAAFLNKDGIVVAALLTTGFALLIVGYLGPYITRLRIGQFEAELERFRRRVAQTLSALEEVARTYESIRARMEPGGERDRMMEDALWQAELDARSRKISKKEITDAFRTNERGKRIWVLGAMRGDRYLRDIDIVIDAIQNPFSGFDQDRFLLLSGEMVSDLNTEERKMLREVIARQLSSGQIDPKWVRWFTAQRVIRLLDTRYGSSTPSN